MFDIQHEEGYMSIKASGKSSHHDYEKHLIPELEKAFQAHQKIKLLVDLEDFEGWEWQAVWDDFKVGIQHIGDYEKIALVGNAAWEEYLLKFFNFFLAGEFKYFDVKDREKAKAWMLA